jgi:YVTN family beta-propeller protein
MKKNNLKQLMVILLSLVIFFSACDDDDDSISGIFSDGVFITNEGAYNAGNGSVSFYAYKGDTLTNEIFKSINDRSLGDVVQSLTVHDGKAYIVVNVSNKIEIVQSHDFIEQGVITDVTSPRYFVGINKNKGYATQWGEDGVVKVIDLDALAVTKTISVGAGPEHIIYHNNYVYVANSGGLANDNTVSVIDPSTDAVVKTITLDGDSPRDFAVDANGDLWVLCNGYIEYDYSDWSIISETASKLIRIDPTTNEVVQTITISDNHHPSCLESSRDGNKLFYGGSFGYQGIYKMDITSTSVPTTPLLDKYFYGFNINSETGNIFALEAPTFTANGTLWRYNEDGKELGSYEAGVGPNGASTKRSKE